VQHPDIVLQMRKELAAIRDARPPQQQFWMTIDREAEWSSTVIAGTCKTLPMKQCVFAHPWLADDVDDSQLHLVHGAAAWPFIRNITVHLGPYLLLILATAAMLGRVCSRLGGARRRKAPRQANAEHPSKRKRKAE
jgi:hypothetical protein